MLQDLGVCGSRWSPRALAAAVLVVLALPITAADAKTATTHVVGGTPASAAQFPYLATLKSGGQFICGGSLIMPDRVLTAAHCVNDLTPGDVVVVGPSAATRTIIHIAQDPRLTALIDRGFPPSSVPPYDVAILQLNAPVTDVAPIRLAQAADAALYRPGAWLITVGMGSTDREGGGSGVLRFAQVQARSDADCKSLLAPLNADEEFNPATMICTTDPDGAAPFRSGCYGDSGAPLVAIAPDGSVVQVGIDDWGVACGFRDGDPENYVEVPVIAGFALAASPIWRPEPLGRPKLTGTVRVGRTVRCSRPRYADPQPDKVARAFFVLRGNSATLVGRGGSYRIKRAHRGRRLACVAFAHSAGGEVTTASALKRIR